MNLILACQIAGVYDVNRNITLDHDDYSKVTAWADSLKNHKIKGILFHNNFSENTVTEYQDDFLEFVKVDHLTSFNPNVFRYFVYKSYIYNHINEIKNVFLTDVSDVIVVNNPFTDPYFINHHDGIFCGDENELLSNTWMKNHSTHLRNHIDDFSTIESKFQNAPLLNCGIIGGNIEIMRAFLDNICEIHFHYNQNNKTAFTGDMGAFNYVIRKYFNEKILHGAPINTVFKAYEDQRIDCWFRHK